jgi:hypothetical protein
MGIFNRKRKVDPNELAQSLVTEFVDDTTFDDRPQLELTADIEPHYRAKSRLYRIAIVLMALMSHEQRNPKFSTVRLSFEALVFPQTQAKGYRLLQSVRSAMQNLSELLWPTDNPKELSWAVAWLQDVGITDVNPVDIVLFSKRWMDSYVMIANVLDEVRPL